MDTPDTVRLSPVVSRDGEWCVERALEVELASRGETIEEVVANFREAAELYFEGEPAPDVPAPLAVHLHAA